MYSHLVVIFYIKIDAYRITKKEKEKKWQDQEDHQ